MIIGARSGQTLKAMRGACTLSVTEALGRCQVHTQDCDMIMVF